MGTPPRRPELTLKTTKQTAEGPPSRHLQFPLRQHGIVPVTVLVHDDEVNSKRRKDNAIVTVVVMSRVDF